jgi:hypothetical protein
MKPSNRYRIVLVGFTLILSGIFFSGTLVGCQEADQPKTTLTQKQWQEVKGHLLEKKPDPEYPIGANFGDKIELIGFDVTRPLEAGKKATFTWYWKALDNIEENWRIFTHFDSSKESYRQNLDHHPIDGLYQTSRWKKGQIIEDVQHVTIKSDYPAGQAVAYIGFYKGSQRLPIKNDVKKTKDRRVIAPPLTIKNSSAAASKSKAKKLPSAFVPSVDDDAAKEFTIDGKLDEKLWATAEPIHLQPFGAAPDLKTKVSVLRGKEHLYIGAHLPDENVWSELEERDSNTWNEEVFEVYIDKGRDGKDYFEFQINPLATIFDAHFVERLGRGKGSRSEQIDRAKAFNIEGLESAVHVEGTINDNSDKDTFWSVELKIPYTAIPGVDAAPKADESWAVNFYRYDRPAGPADKKRTFAFAWSKPDGGSFHQVERFGSLNFSDEAKSDEAKSGKTNAVNRIDPAKLKQLQRLKLNQIKPKAPNLNVKGALGDKQ